MDLLEFIAKKGEVMAEDISNRTVAVLLILTIVVSVLGALFIATKVDDKAREQLSRPDSTSLVRLTILDGSEKDAIIRDDSTISKAELNIISGGGN